ncbi:MAG: hypothetical protein U5O39_10365 [Gammaproteobacteria bacterium]|nr:hypothetical protein [Gammaproteobacteria bacterium]
MAHTGMLRASCESLDIELDISVIVDPTRRCGIPHYRELIDFADALLDGDHALVTTRRQALRNVVGQDGIARAAAVVGNFQMMNRALDTLGATFGDRMPSRVKAMAKEMGVTPPPHWPDQVPPKAPFR